MGRNGWIVLGLGLLVAAAATTLLWRAPWRKQVTPALVLGPIELHDVTAETGITYHHTDGSSGHKYIVEAMSAGLALFDYDSDGWIDIYFLNGAPMRGTEYEKPPQNALYRNLGNWRFRDVTREAGVGDTGFGLGVTVGDYNNDGAPDLYLNNFGPNVLYRNNGDGTFTDVTTEAGVSSGNLVGAGASFLDIEQDGDVDLYAANYLEFDYAKHVERTMDGLRVYPSPRDYQPVADTLYRNNGDDTFTDISVEAGITAVAGTSMGIVAADYDQDGDCDVFTFNDVAENFLFRNDGTGVFEEVGMLVGAAYDGFGDENASMGADYGDYDNDGWIDFYMTSYQAELPVLYRNLGDGNLEDVTRTTNAGSAILSHVNWGNGLIDFDNDGDRDIFIANGHTEDNIDLIDKQTTYKVRNTLLMNTGGGRFEDISTRCGDGLLPQLASRGTAFDDLDNDGDIDAAVLNSRDPCTILRNDSANDHHWLQLRVLGVTTNRDAIGTRVVVTSGDLTQVAEMIAGRSYQSYYGSRLHFGLGSRDHVDRIEIHWQGGETEVIEDLSPDQFVTIRQFMPKVNSVTHVPVQGG